MLILTQVHDPKGDYISLFDRYQDLLLKYNLLVGVTEATDKRITKTLEGLKMSTIEVGEYGEGRRALLQHGLKAKEEYFFYSDFDKIFHWLLTEKNEFEGLLKSKPESDFLILGRNKLIFSTYPRSWLICESIANEYLSRKIGQKIDALTAACVLSRKAVKVLSQKSKSKGWGSAVEWPLLAYKAGLKIGYQEMKGLTFEDADRFEKEMSQMGGLQKWLLNKYDSDAEWGKRCRALAEQIEVLKTIAR